MINWSAIDTVLLDMDGTLLDLHFDNHFWLEHLPKRLAQQRGLAEAQLRPQLLQQMDSERGSLNWYCLEFWAKTLDTDIVALKEEIAHKIAIRPFVLEFLQGLRQQGKQLWLVTNAHRDSLKLKLRRTQLELHLDKLLVSHDFQLPKEDPAFWQRLHRAHPFDKRRTLLIDDSAPVLKSAQTYGIAHLLTLKQPDSQQALRTTLEFPGIHHFDEIMPAHE